MSVNSGPILHIIVVGFHHKKGCQVEFSFPPLVPGSPNDCPTGWKYLPTLALPDGSHNYTEDSVFFNLPSLEFQDQTVFGVSCYRQIPVEKLINRTADVTRSTVQKSVCALSSVALYGHVEVKLSLIAHAYFDQGDFSRTDLLIDAYDNLNKCLNQGVSPTQMLVGLSVRELVLRWRHKALLLFKLLLLEKRIVFFGSPVRPLCLTLLGVLSLHPDMIEKGLNQAASVRTSRPMSPMPDFDLSNQEQKKITTPILTKSRFNQEEKLEKIFDQPVPLSDNCDSTEMTLNNDKYDLESDEEKCSPNLNRRSEKGLPRDTSVDALASAAMAPLCAVGPSSWGAPLSLFSQGYLCLPYLSLPYLDLLTDPCVRGYIIGASNVLFRQKRHLADVLVDVDNGTIESQDLELRKQLTLSTEDLRFADFIVRYTCTPPRSNGAPTNGTSTNNLTCNETNTDIVGGEDWIRGQFQGYMLALLKTSMLPEGSREYEHFNGSFMAAWKQTESHRLWVDGGAADTLEGIIPGHPCAGQLSVADMKLRLAQSMQNSESGRKLNQAVSNTSRAVGGAISQARGALTNWWSSLTTAQSPGNDSNVTVNNDDDDDDIDDEIESKIENIDVGTDLIESVVKKENLTNVEMKDDESNMKDSIIHKISIINEGINEDDNLLKKNNKSDIKNYDNFIENEIKNIKIQETTRKPGEIYTV